MYNGDASKLKLEVQNPIETVSTYSDEFNPISQKFVMLNGRRLVRYCGVTQEKYNNQTTSTIKFGNLDSDLSSCGLVSGNVNVVVAYNGAKIGTITFNPNKNATSSGLHPKRQFYLDVAKAAVAANGGKKSYADDWHAIRDYVYDNYQYPPEGESGTGPDYINCIGGARIFETYSMYEYNVYGFLAYPPDSTNYGSHVAFYRDDAPNGIKYETQGHK